MFHAKIVIVIKEVWNMGSLKVFSFFSGSGFLDLGFETTGFDIELVKRAFADPPCRVYRPLRCR